MRLTLYLTALSNAAPNKKKKASSTVEMAAALLTRAFSPRMAIDYGCAGRGEFDPFSVTIGAPIDDIDHAFFVWKTCVQCATEDDKSIFGAYEYDVADDYCGKLKRINTF